MKRLVMFRKGLKLTQNQMAEKLNIPRATYQSYENGRNQPNIATLIKMADLFGVSVDTLVEHDANIVDLHTVSKNQKFIIEKVVNNLSDEEIGEIVGHIKTFKH